MADQVIGTREIGIIVIVMSIILLALMLSITDQLNQTLHAECVCEEGVCPMSSNLPVQSYAGFTMITILAAFGIYLVARSRQFEGIRTEKEAEVRKAMKTLSADEKKIYETVADSDGVVFQGELVEQLGFSKVKVSRVLDRLEHKGLVERRRRGMSNVIILKHTHHT